ncbi:MAG: phosphoglucomutase/phosphomannomutase family protein [Endomicrobiales bacterium]|nr:phosphoglucomutase/phosphomannomutase family protein [Endomicrobiales bacterium]
MNRNNIKFGTDGWRGVMAEDFTFGNVRRVAGAVAEYLRAAYGRDPLVVIGHDTRFHSGAFARAAAEELAKGGCRPVISKGVVSTPCLSSGVLEKNARGGVMITASHNPYEFNGFKFKTEKGSSAPESVTKEFEKYISSEQKRPSGPVLPVTEADIVSGYLKRISDFVDSSAIRRKPIKVVFDPMYGAAQGYLQRLLKPAKCRVISVHDGSDPLFGGLHPEPIGEFLGDLAKAVKRSGSDIGVATDGDGDRVGVVDEKGRYLPPHTVFPLLLYYLAKYKGMKGKVAQTISLGYVSERIARDFNLDWEETPVGFKYIADRILRGGFLFGGEESGGYGYGGFLPERDGVLNAVMLIEMLASVRKPLSVLVADIEKKYGKSYYVRRDFRNPGIPKEVFVQEMKIKVPRKIAGLGLKQVKDYDGIEFVLEDDSWLLLRPSGTEPVIRVYCESNNPEKTRKIILWGKKAVSELVSS